MSHSVVLRREFYFKCCIKKSHLAQKEFLSLILDKLWMSLHLEPLLLQLFCHFMCFKAFECSKGNNWSSKLKAQLKTQIIFYLKLSFSSAWSSASVNLEAQLQFSLKLSFRTVWSSASVKFEIQLQFSLILSFSLATVQLEAQLKFSLKLSISSAWSSASVKLEAQLQFGLMLSMEINCSSAGSSA